MAADDLMFDLEADTTEHIEYTCNAFRTCGCNFIIIGEESVVGELSDIPKICEFYAAPKPMVHGAMAWDEYMYLFKIQMSNHNPSDTPRHDYGIDLHEPLEDGAWRTTLSNIDFKLSAVAIFDIPYPELLITTNVFISPEVTDLLRKKLYECVIEFTLAE